MVMCKFILLHTRVLITYRKYNGKTRHIFANTLTIRVLTKTQKGENITELLSYFAPICMISCSKRSFSTQDLFFTRVLYVLMVWTE